MTYISCDRLALLCRALAMASLTIQLNGAGAYELVTHGLLTYKAFAGSGLQAGSKLYEDLGIQVFIAPMNPESRRLPFGASYYDFSGADVKLRMANTPGMDAQQFDVSKMPKVVRSDGFVEFLPASDSLRVPGWILRGSIREDDDSSDSEPNPKDDPFTTLWPLLKHRVMSHFYDPVSRKGVNKGGITPGLPAPAWAIGVAPANMFETLSEEDTGRSNHFTIHDAREAMFRALTGLNRELGRVANDEVERKRYWATAFRALGDVVHLVQDMSQPQHTRNEPHAGFGDYGYQPLLLGHKSVLEAYIEARAIGSRAFEYKATDNLKLQVQIIPERPLMVDGYPVPRFDRFVDYFSTAPIEGIENGAGMADYSNRGFLTPASNLGNAEYALPPSNPGAYRTASVPVVGWSGMVMAADEKITLFLGTVTDTVDPSRTASDVPLSSQSAWGEFLQRRGKFDASLNWFNYDAAANLLLPRAVAYSAGLIDYFFRGKLEISLPDEGVYGVIDHSVESQPYTSGFRKIKLRVRNATPPVIPSAGPDKGRSIAQDMSGTVLAVVKYHENTCYQADLSGEFGSQEVRTRLGDLAFNDPAALPPGCRRSEEKITVSEPQASVTLAADAIASLLTFTFSNPIPVNATDVYLQVVFRGVHGSEQDAVVVGTRDISEPTHFTLVNVTDYLFCYNDNWYYKKADGTLPAEVPSKYSEALRAQPFSAARFAFGKHAGAIDGGALSNPLVVASDVAPGQFARFTILTEPETAFNDEIAGFYSPVPPPYKLHNPAGNQLTVHGTDLPGDPYTLERTASEVGAFRNSRYVALTLGYLAAGSGDCIVRPIPAAPALPWKPFPVEPEYASTPTMKSVAIDFN